MRYLIFADGLLKINGALFVRQEHEFEQKSNNDVIGAPRADAFLLIFNPFPEAIFY